MTTATELEGLLVRSNPVPDAERLRLSAAEMDARIASILEGRDTMVTTPTRRPVQTPPPHRSRRPLLVLAAGMILVLLIGGGVLLLTGDPDRAPATTTPTPTTPAPTTTTAATPTTPAPTTPIPTTPSPITLTTPAYEEVPSYRAVVRYYEHDPTAADPGWQATVAIRFAGPMRYEAEVVAGGSPHLVGPGALLVGDGTATWLRESSRQPFQMISATDHFRHLVFDSARPDWAEVCAGNAQEVGSEVLLSRTVVRVTCAAATDHYELWVDQETGLVLKLTGPLPGGDHQPVSASDGGFEFTELSFEPVTIGRIPEPGVAIRPGDRAPMWSGPLVGGGTFDLADHVASPAPTGRMVVVLSWFPGCGDMCFEALDVMQRLYLRFQADVTFVTASEDTLGLTVNVVRRQAVDVPTVYCWNDPDPVTGSQFPACATPGPVYGDPIMDVTPWYVWGNPIPSVTILDDAGVVIGLFTGPTGYETGEIDEGAIAELLTTPSE